MATKYFCDNCGKEFKTLSWYDDKGEDHYALWQLRGRIRQVGSTNDAGGLIVELCEDCHNKLLKIIKDGFANE